MKCIKPLVLLLISALLLSGCDQVKQAAAISGSHQPPVTFPDGWAMNNNGRKALVTGSDFCLDDHGRATQVTGCIVIGAQTRTVNVTLTDAVSGAQQRETWTLENRQGSVLKRPDNSTVSAWDRS